MPPVATFSPLPDWWPLVSQALLLTAYPLYVWLMSFVLRRCGVPQKEVAKWALRQVDRQRITDLFRASRGLPVLPVDVREPR